MNKQELIYIGEIIGTFGIKGELKVFSESDFIDYRFRKGALVKIGSKKEKLEVKGRDMVNGLPHTITITSEEIEEALRESINEIVRTIKQVLEITPPELSADIINKGIVLTGGGSMLDGLDILLKKELKVPVFIAESPLTCVAEGTGKMLENLHLIDE